MANPGPASSTFGNFVIDQQNAYRLVAFAKGVNLSAAGDTLANVITSGAFVPAVIVTTNSNSTVPNVAAATVGAYTLPSQGGTTVWENVVIACVPCNQTKGGRTPEQAKMKLKVLPVRPKKKP